MLVEDKASVKEILDHDVIRESLPHTVLLHVNEDENAIDIWSATETFFTTPLEQTPPRWNRFQVMEFTFVEEKPILPLVGSLNGKELKLAGLMYRPYTYYEFVEPGTGNAHLRDSGKKLDVYLDGTEFLVFLQFCKKYNCSLNLELGKLLPKASLIRLS